MIGAIDCSKCVMFQPIASAIILVDSRKADMAREFAFRDQSVEGGDVETDALFFHHGFAKRR
ncbi:MAG: hypothetical protein MZU97_03510 [Bacillus subtilis]|nr:hypothetical protein [Bacillus subtilis]